MIKEILIEYKGIKLAGHFSSFGEPKAWVVFAHGSGSSRKSGRNNWVASELNKRGFGTLLFDLLTEEEDAVFQNRFNIKLLSERLLAATRWLVNAPYYKKNTPIAYFGASTGAGAALMAAAHADVSWPLFAVVSRGGRADLAEKDNLNKVKVPTLLVVGDRDYEVIELNEMALREIPQAQIILIPGATHLFAESGTLDAVVKVVVDWLQDRLRDRAYIYGDSLS
jgi:putative phosphoribosyl transferase